jgi:hypothetical protein
MTTYYVATTGNNANPGTSGAPFQTLAHLLTVMAAGDLGLVAPGTYAESLSSFPAGTNWSAAITVRAQDAANRPVIQPPVSGASEYRCLYFQSSSNAYIEFDGFVLDGVNTNPDAVKITNGANHIRLRNCEITNAQRQGVLTSGGSGFNEFLNCHAHHNGTDTGLDHGFYISTDHNLIDGCEFDHNAGYGLQVYDSGGTAAHDNTVRNCISHDQAVKHGMVISSGSNNVAYNNVCYGNASGGIHVNYCAVSTGIYNNTLTGNSGPGLEIGSGSTGAVARNNILVGNSSALSNSGTSTTSDHNLLSGSASFVDATAHDYRLQSGSAAIDAGATIALVTTDLLGVTRPQGTAYDLGAYEYQAAPATYTLTLTPGTNGSAVASPSGPTYSAGNSVTVTATPSTGYTFDHWNLDGGTSMANPLNLTMNADHTVQPVFAVVPVTHTLTLTPGAHGTVAASPAGPTINDGTVVTITATPDAGYVFDHWLVDGVVTP